jgi:hypothetical protein
MKTNPTFILTFLLLSIFIGSCTDNEELPENQAKGQITHVFDGCYGQWLMIEVDQPNNIGKTGHFVSSPSTSHLEFDYTNAIGVPWFSKISEIPDTVPDIIGTWLYFEYRGIEQGDDLLFETVPPVYCPAVYLIPDVNQYVVTKVFKYN